MQEKLRAFGFSDFNRHIVQQLMLSLGKEETSHLPPASQSRYIFGDISGTSGFIIENSSLAYQTTAYQTFESFLKVFQEGIRIVNEALCLDFIERIGLRYLDAVQPRSGQSLSKYLKAGVLGLSQSIKAPSLVYSYNHTVEIIALGHLVSKVIIQDGQIALPPELAQLGPKIDQRFMASRGRHAILDTDAFCQDREPFSTETISHKLTALHEEINKAFNTIVTPYALAAWK